MAIAYYRTIPFIIVLGTINCLHEKWIVVTTIQYPTEQLRKLASLKDWHLLVVGDKKTPHDWYLDNGEYLSPERQQQLGYKLANVLPWNHYSRKNIGYLYAIEHGASIIYDTDDDNEPLADLIPLSTTALLPIVSSPNLCMNIYAYFGRADIWPRGYPLEGIHHTTYSMLASRRISVGIEQGVVNGEPDVDAIFRLTRPQEEIYFNAHVPCALDKNIFCPFNSQNTFFHKKAFFTLYLPSTVSMRVADIWRGYCAQKLLSILDMHVVFSGPNALQKRNEHNLMHDFLLEQDLYSKTSKLLRSLHQWSCPGEQNPSQALYDLLHDLVTKDFFAERELELCKAWIDDLGSIGYDF